MIGRWRAHARARRLLNEAAEHRREARLPEAEVALAGALEAARGSGDAALIAECSRRLGGSLWRQRRYAEAEAVKDEQIAACTTANGRDHDRTLDAVEDAITMRYQQGHAAEAQPYGERRLEMETRRAGEGSVAWALALTTLAWSLREQGRLDEAEAHCRRALAALEATKPKHGRVGWALAGLAAILQARGDLPGAEAYFKRAAEAWDRDGELGVANGTRERLIELYLASGRPDDALTLSNRFQEVVVRQHWDERARLRRTERHARVLRAAGKQAEAARFELRAGFLRAAIDKEQAELAESRRRAGEESVVGDELAEGQMWHDPAGPVYLERR